MRRLQDQRIWLGGAVVAAILIVAGSWLLLVGPQLSSAHELHSEAVAAQHHNVLLEAKKESLEAKSANLARYTSSLKKALAALPYDSGLPALTRQLSAQGRASGVSVESVVVGEVTAVPTAADAASPDSSTSSSADSAEPLFSIAVTVTSKGPAAGQIAFLRAVRAVGPRRALITSTQVSPASGSDAGSISRAASFTTILTAFSSPKTPAQIRQLNQLASGNLER